MEEAVFFDMFDYISWRGDLDFRTVPFNQMDALVLCQLTYLDFNGLVSTDFSDKSCSLKKLDELYLNREPPADARILELLHSCARSTRYSSILLCGHETKFEMKEEKQFCGITYILSEKDKNACIVYRGTDTSIIGWKEDFNMTYIYPVPSQEEGLEYLERAAKSLKRYKFCIAGHSKGGNTAMFASSLCSDKTFKRIKRIYTFDSPGFDKKLTDTSVFKKPLPILQAYVPVDSIIGQLMETPDQYTVVDSCSEGGLEQHDPFSWNFRSYNFITIPTLSQTSQDIKSTLNEWLDLLDLDQRKQFVNSLFKILYDMGIRELPDLQEFSLGKALGALKAFAGLDPTAQDCIKKALGLLFSVITNRNKA